MIHQRSSEIRKRSFGQHLKINEGLTVGSFFIGLPESFLYGVYAGLVYMPIYNFYRRKWGM